MNEGAAVALVRRRLADSIAIGKNALDSPCLTQVARAARTIAESLATGGKVLTFGNGGSSMDAGHLAAELLGRFSCNRRPLAAVCLSDQTAAMTAIANDFGFADVFARQVVALGRTGDVAVGLTTSGGSENVVQALVSAKTAGIATVVLTGADGGRVAPLADVCIQVPSNDTAHVQEVCMHLAHSICALVERTLYPRRTVAATARFTTVFLDRDGTLNVRPPDGQYLTSPDKLQLLPGAARSVRRLNEAAILVVIVTNQRAVSRGLIDAARLAAIHDRLVQDLAAQGAFVDGIYTCTHDPGECTCRKPLPGLLMTAAVDHPEIALADAVMIGDMESDVAAGKAAGTATVRLGARGDPSQADVVVADLSAAVDWILQSQVPSLTLAESAPAYPS